MEKRNKMSNNLYEQIGESIRLLRLKNGMSQQELAEELELTRSSISTWEIGANGPSVENLVNLAEIFETTVDSVLGLRNRTAEKSTIRERNLDYLYGELPDDYKEVVETIIRSLSLYSTKKKD